MFGIMLSALRAVIGPLMTTLFVKFVVFGSLFMVVVGFMAVLQGAGIMPNSSTLSGAFGNIGSGMWYFLDLFRFDLGIPMALSAYGARFLIRRIPFIG